MQRTQTIWVINGNADPHEDRFNGDDYVFPVGEPVEIPLEGADLMFGYGLKDKTPTLMRSGRAPTAKDIPTGLKWLSGFSFHNSQPAAVPALVEGTAPGAVPLSDSGAASNTPAEPTKADRTIRPRVPA